MKDLMKHLDILISRYPVLEESRQDIEKAYLVLEECYREKKKVIMHRSESMRSLHTQQH